MTHHYLYILAGQMQNPQTPNPRYQGPIYIGTTRDLKRRISQHRTGRVSIEAFRIDRLVYVERHASIEAACTRAEALRASSREWLDALVERRNPDWRDMASAAMVEVERAA